MRIPYLKKLFPKVKLVHIYRNPLDTIPSTMHMWNIVGQQNALRKEFTPPSLENSVEIYDTMLWKIRRDLVDIPQNDYCEIGFEELEQQPFAAIERICRTIDIPFSKTYEENIKRFLNKMDKYKKNSYRLLTNERDYIIKNLKHHMKYYGYNNDLKESKASFINITESFITGILQLRKQYSNNQNNIN
jgi:hypothetical protein